MGANIRIQWARNIYHLASMASGLGITANRRQFCNTISGSWKIRHAPSYSRNGSEGLAAAFRRFDPAAGRPPLEDAAKYITKLPKAQHEAPEWQMAIEVLMLVARLNGPTMMARHESAEPPRRSPVQSQSQRPSLGKAEIETGRIVSALQQLFCSFDGTAVLIRRSSLANARLQSPGRKGLFSKARILSPGGRRILPGGPFIRHHNAGGPRFAPSLSSSLTPSS
jgi:hypothetical protein